MQYDMDWERDHPEVQTCTRPFPHICKVNGPCNGWPKDETTCLKGKQKMKLICSCGYWADLELLPASDGGFAYYCRGCDSWPQQ